jgi:pyocin large subunit-like protein
MKSEEFKEYFKRNHIQVTPEYGYIHINLNKAYYFPGQIVRGRVYVQLTQQIQTTQAILKISGEENNGYDSKQVMKPSAANQRQAFINNKNGHKSRERKQSAILDIPTLNIVHSQNQTKSQKNIGINPRRPVKHAKSEFL